MSFALPRISRAVIVVCHLPVSININFPFLEKTTSGGQKQNDKGAASSPAALESRGRPWLAFVVGDEDEGDLAADGHSAQEYDRVVLGRRYSRQMRRHRSQHGARLTFEPQTPAPLQLFFLLATVMMIRFSSGVMIVLVMMVKKVVGEALRRLLAVLGPSGGGQSQALLAIGTARGDDAGGGGDDDGHRQKRTVAASISAFPCGPCFR
jgi:hypothetical protein